MSLKIASWNVNSLKVRLPQVLDWLGAAQPDVLALQETKLTDEQFPLAELQAAGYQAVFAGQKTYNGVAILSQAAATNVITDIPQLDDPQRRILVADIAGIRVINLYVVNGQAVDSEKYTYKLRWLDAVHGFVQQQLQQYPSLVVLGDFNIAPDDRDVHDPAAWADKVLCSEPERQALRNLLGLGLHDTFRLFTEEAGQFSWWDYRAAAFRRKLGLRIDLILASDTLKSHCVAAGIDREPRTWERPSDHTPVWAEFTVA